MLRRNHLCQKQARPLPGNEPFEGIFFYLTVPMLRRAMSQNGISLRGAKPWTRSSAYIALPRSPFLENLFASLLACFKAGQFPGERLMELKMQETVLTLIETAPWLRSLLFDFATPAEARSARLHGTILPARPRPERPGPLRRPLAGRLQKRLRPDIPDLARTMDCQPPSGGSQATHGGAGRTAGRGVPCGRLQDTEPLLASLQTPVRRGALLHGPVTPAAPATAPNGFPEGSKHSRTRRKAHPGGTSCDKKPYICNPYSTKPTKLIYIYGYQRKGY